MPRSTGCCQEPKTQPQAQDTTVPRDVDRRKPGRPHHGWLVTSRLLVPAEASKVLAFFEELAQLRISTWVWGLPVKFSPEHQIQSSWEPS